jgi:hypothetical protein
LYKNTLRVAPKRGAIMNSQDCFKAVPPIIKAGARDLAGFILPPVKLPPKKAIDPKVPAMIKGALL